MKRILIGILIILLVALGATTIINGFKIGEFEVLGVNNLKQKSANLDKKIEEATILTSSTFKTKESDLSSASRELKVAREKYQDKVAYSSEEDVRRANEIETYQVDFLFTRLGNHAKKCGLEIDLSAELTSASGVYNLRFAVHGNYMWISDFVSAVENDKSLTFRIEQFELTPEVNGSTADLDTLRAVFIVPNLRLDIDENISNSNTTIRTQSSNSGDSKNGTSTNTNSTNSTNNTNTNNTNTNNTNTNNTNNTNTNNNESSGNTVKNAIDNEAAVLQNTVNMNNVNNNV